MMNTVRFSFIAFLAGAAVTAAPCAFAQKGKSLVRAVKSVASQEARQAVRTEIPSAAVNGLAAQMTAAAREEAQIHAQAVPELARALKDLSYKYTGRGSQNAQFLIATKVKDPALKEELSKLVKSRQIRQAVELLESRSLKVFSFPDALNPDRTGTLSALDSQLSALDFTSGPEVARAARLLADARKAGLLPRARYVAMLEALAEGKPDRLFKVLRRETSSEFLPKADPARESKLLQTLMERESWSDLTPRELVLPDSHEQIRISAIRKVIGVYVGGQKHHLSRYKAYYDKQPVWVQSEMDAKITLFEETIKQRHAEMTVQNKYHRERYDFVNRVRAFFLGTIQQSPLVLNYLYSPHVPVELKQQLRAYMGRVPQDQAGRKAFSDKAREFYDVWAANKSAGVRFHFVQDDVELKQLLKMLNGRGVPVVGPEEADLAAELLLSSNPVTAECARRAQHAMQAPSLAGETLEKLKSYVALHHRLPVSTGQLYHQVQHFKDYPNPFQAEFKELFEKYRVPGRPRKN